MIYVTNYVFMYQGLIKKLSSPEAFNWKQAMKIEYDSLSNNKTWDVVKTPEDKQVGKWVYSKKLNKNNDLTKYKARYLELIIMRHFPNCSSDFDQSIDANSCAA